MSTITHSRIIKNLPLDERESELINEIIRAISVQMNALEISNEQSYAELFINTAVEALRLHERDLSIPYNGSLSLQQRRELIIASYRATLDQTTDESIKSVAAAFSNGEVEIFSTDTDGVYEIKFVGSVGIPDNMPGLMSTIYNILPAHLDVIYTYRYNVWDDIAKLTWNEVSSFTWNELLNEELV